MSTFFGLDIGSAQVKLLQVEKDQNNFKLSHFAAVDLVGDDVATAITQAGKEAKIRSAAEVNLALPESDVYTRIVEMPRLSEAELASSIKYEAEQYVPVPLEEVNLFHQILDGAEEQVERKNMDVLLIAVPVERLKKLTDLMDQANLIPKSLETELFSLKRVFQDVNKAQLILLFGHKSTDMMILDKGVPKFLHSMATGGMALTKLLANELSLTEEQAEQYKRTYGLRAELLEGKVAKLLMPAIDEVVNQITKAQVYLQQQGGVKMPEQIVVSGGGAMLPGLTSYLVSKLNLEVVVGDPFARFVKDNKFTEKIAAKDNPQLSTAVGLAVKGLV